MPEIELVICTNNRDNEELKVSGTYECTLHISEVPFWRCTYEIHLDSESIFLSSKKFNRSFKLLKHHRNKRIKSILG
jgi:hypothetical protein